MGYIFTRATNEEILRKTPVVNELRGNRFLMQRRIRPCLHAFNEDAEVSGKGYTMPNSKEPLRIAPIEMYSKI